MKKELKDRIIQLVISSCQRIDEDINEEAAESLIDNLMGLYDECPMGLGMRKAREAVKNALTAWASDNHYGGEISDADIQKMMDAVFSEGKSATLTVSDIPAEFYTEDLDDIPPDTVFHGGYRVFDMPEVLHAGEVLAVVNPDHPDHGTKETDKGNHIRGIRLLINLFPEVCSDPEALLTLFNDLYYVFFQGPEPVPVGRDFYRLFNVLKDVLRQIYKYNPQPSCVPYNNYLLYEIISGVSRDLNSGINLDAGPLSNIALIGRIEELFDPENDQVSLDTESLHRALINAVKKHINDEKDADHIADIIQNNPYDLDPENTDPQMPEIPDADKVIELTVPEYEAASYAYKLSGDLFDDVRSDQEFLHRLYFAIHDGYINGTEKYSKKDADSVTRIYHELAKVLEVVFKDNVEEWVRQHSYSDEELIKRKRTKSKKYRSEDIYSLYREIALELADGNPEHVGIYHALYAIAVITEKMTLDELIFEVGDYIQPEDSEDNKRIITACKGIKDFAYDVNQSRDEKDRINLQSVLSIFPPYKKELNGDSEEGTMLSRSLMADFEKMAVDTLINQGVPYQAWEIKSIDKILDWKNEYKKYPMIQDWQGAWSKKASEIAKGADDDFRTALPEEFIASSDDGRFWIEALYIILYGIIIESKSKPYRPLAMAIRYNPPVFDVLEGVGNKSVDFKNAVDAGEELYKNLIEGFEKDGDTFPAIIGQDAAIRKFTDAYEYALMFNKKADRPQAVYLFVGPPGVGKTMLAENAARLLDRPFKRFDMSEYAGGGNDGTADVNGLIGFEKTWKGAQPGVLTTYVDGHPNAILLFDEIEKAGKAVARLFLSILEGARLTDKFTEKTVSFSKTILIFTTNAGKDLYEDNQNTDLSTISDGAVIEALRGTNEKREPKNKKDLDTFPPELVSRFATSNIILFNHLDGIALKNIAKSGFEVVRDESAKSGELLIDLGDKERLSYAYMFSQGKLDARVISSGSRKFLGGKIRDAFKEAGNSLAGIDRQNIQISFAVDTDRLKEGSKEQREIHNLFPPAEGEAISEGRTVSALYITDAKETTTRINWLKIDLVSTYDSFRDQIDKRRDPYDMIIVDLSTGDNTDIYNGEAEGIKCLNALADIPGSQVVCVVAGKGIELSDHDRENIMSRGVSKILPIYGNDESWLNATTDTYIKRSIRALADDGYVLDFDTAIVSEKKTDEKGKPQGIIQVKLTNLRYIEAEVEDADTRREDAQSLVSESGRPKVKFGDIIGADSAKKQLQDIIEYVKNPAKYDIMNCPAPRGLLLHGYPGTGKTMLAKALAGESKMAFIATTGSELVSKGADGVKYVFDLARRKRKAIIFIDEFDALGSVRTGAQTYKEFAVNRLLTEMDGFSNDKKRLIFVIAATNAAFGDRDFSIDVRIDEAVERRFGKSLVVELPLKKDRIVFIGKRLKDMNQSIGDDAISVAADLTGGKSLANIESYLQNCIRHAIRDENENYKKVKMTEDRFLNYLQEELFGDSNEKKTEADQTTAEKKDNPVYHTAIHEAGHALLSYIAGEEPAILTVSGRGNYAGFYLPAEKSDDKIPTKKDLLNKIDVSLAGGIAETVIFGEDMGTTTGVSSDLAKATRIVRNMITKYGMAVGKSNSIAVIRDDRLVDRAIGDTSLSKELLDDINSVLHNEKEKTKEIIEKNRDVLTELADAVYDSKGKYLTGAQIKEILGRINK